jgi:hypothetical protein
MFVTLFCFPIDATSKTHVSSFLFVHAIKPMLYQIKETLTVKLKKLKLKKFYIYIYIYMCKITNKLKIKKKKIQKEYLPIFDAEL